MKGEVELSFALHSSGLILHIDEVKRGLKCDCVCPKCKKEVVARHGDINQHCFAHVSRSLCDGGQETALHEFAKRIAIEEGGELTLPNYDHKYFDDMPYIMITYTPNLGEMKSVQIEKNIHSNTGDIRPDAIIQYQYEKVAFEFCVEHPVDSKKEKIIKQLHLATVEIYLSRYRHSLSKEKWRQAILNGAYRKWIYPPSHIRKEITQEITKRYKAFQLIEEQRRKEAQEDEEQRRKEAREADERRAAADRARQLEYDRQYKENQRREEERERERQKEEELERVAQRKFEKAQKEEQQRLEKEYQKERQSHNNEYWKNLSTFKIPLCDDCNQQHYPTGPRLSFYTRCSSCRIIRACYGNDPGLLPEMDFMDFSSWLTGKRMKRTTEPMSYLDSRAMRRRQLYEDKTSAWLAARKLELLGDPSR